LEPGFKAYFGLLELIYLLMAWKVRMPNHLEASLVGLKDQGMQEGLMVGDRAIVKVSS
jgi:hypothetical protein